MGDKSDALGISLKIIVLGDSGVGKSCLIQVYSAIVSKKQESFLEILENAEKTIGFDFISIKISGPEGQLIKLNVWDTAGQEKYQAINKNLYLGSDGALLCFDLSTKVTREKIDFWKREVEENAGKRCGMMIIGTKNDSEVQTETVVTLEEYARENGLLFFETSSKLGYNVREAFKTIALDSLIRNGKARQEGLKEERTNLKDASSDAISAKNCC